MTSSNNFYLLDSVSAIWCRETPSTAELSSFMTLSFFEQINWLNNTICGNDTYASLIAHIQTMVLLMNSPTINYFIYFECYEISAHRQTTEKKTRSNCAEWKRRRNRVKWKRRKCIVSRFLFSAVSAYTASHTHLYLHSSSIFRVARFASVLNSAAITTPNRC